MARRAGAMLVVAFLVFAFLVRPSTPLRAQGGASPQASPGLNLGQTPGFTLHTLAGGTTDKLPSTAPLILERVTLPPGADTGMRQLSAPELVAVEGGTVAVTDSLGLESDMSQGDQTLFESGAAYEARNNGGSPATLLRLSLGPAQVSAPASATSAAGTPAAVGTPGAPAKTTTLLKSKDEQLPAGAALIFLARATYAPGADTGDHTHAGPVGIYVESGTLSISSPSGLKGKLKSDKGVVLPSDTVHREQNQGSEPVDALMFGVITAGQPLMQPIVPTPTPTQPPTPTVAATETPTPTVAATAASAPGVLYQADNATALDKITRTGGWRLFQGMLVNDGSGGSLTLPYRPSTINYAVEVDVQVIQGGRPAFFLSARGGQVAAVVDACCGDNSDVNFIHLRLGDQQLKSSNPPSEIPAANWHTYRIEVSGNQMAALIDGVMIVQVTDNRLISGQSGDISLAAQTNVQVNVRRFKVIALGSGGGGAGATAPASGTAASGGSQVTSPAQAHANPANLTDMLPNQSDVPAGLVQTDEGQRTEDQITSTFRDPADAAQKFSTWNWQGDVYRDFAAPDGSLLPPESTNLIDASVHRFGSALAAAEALNYFADDRAATEALHAVQIPPLADQPRALAGPTGRGNEVTIYARRQDVVLRLTAYSAQGDPTADALAVVKRVLAK